MIQKFRFVLFCRLPFVLTPQRYLCVLAAECYIVSALGLTNVPLICFTIGSIWLISALVKDIVHDLNNFNVQNEKTVQPNGNEQFCCILMNFTEAKELSKHCELNSMSFSSITV